MRQDIEILRIIAAFGIVWFHTGGVFYGKDLGYGGLVFFVIVSIFFYLNRPTHLKKGFERIYVPFILWSIFYLILELATNETYQLQFDPVEIFLTSTSIHLWYLPFLLAVFLLTHYCKTVLQHKNTALGFGLLACLVLFTAQIWREYPLEIPYGQYVHLLPAVFIGLFLGCPEGKSRAWQVIGVLLIGALIYNFYLDLPGMGVTYLVGVAGAALLLIKDLMGRIPLKITVFSGLMFGVYLIHPFVLKIGYKIGLLGPALVVFAFILSVLMIAIAKWIVPKPLQKYLF